MLKTNTYIVCNSSLVPKFKQIEHFKLNLGQSLIDKSNTTFSTKDITIQKHFMFHNNIIYLCGFIGSLSIYNNATCDISNISLHNEKEIFDYTLDNNMSLYDNINLALDLFFDKLGMINHVVTKKDEPMAIIEQETKEEYIKPNKKLFEMTDSEKMSFLRNRK